MRPTHNSVMPRTTHSLFIIHHSSFIIFLFALLTLLLFLSAREDYWLDEGFSLRRVEASWTQLYNPLAVRVPQPADPFDRRDVFDLNPPLYFALIRLLAGPAPSPLVVRGLFSAVPMVLALLFLVLLARRLHGPLAACVMLLLGATAPAVIFYGHEARPYALPLLVACALLWAIPLLRRRPRLLAAACFLAAAAGALMHYTFAWWIVALFTIFAGQWWLARHAGDASARRAALAGAAGLAAGSFIALLAILPALRQLAEVKTAPSQSLSSEVMMNTFAFPFSRVGSRPVSPPLAFALQFAFFVAFVRLLPRSRRAAEGFAALALWLIPVTIPILMKAFLGLAYYERHAFFCLPGWLLALAWSARECGMEELPVASCQLPMENSPLASPLIPHSAFRIPHFYIVLFVSILALNILWSARNLTRPIRAVWTPSIRHLLAHSRPGEAYTIDPDLMAGTFGVIARIRPAADWFSFSHGLPPRAPVIWILAETRINPNPRYDFDPAAWRTQKIIESDGVSLFRAERVKAVSSRL